MIRTIFLLSAALLLCGCGEDTAGIGVAAPDPVVDTGSAFAEAEAEVARLRTLEADPP